MRVLVVDDEPNIVRFIEAHLVKHGYTVETAGDGVEALAKIRANMPDIVVTDIMMPNMDGFELLAALKTDAKFTAIKTILLSICPYEEANEAMVAKEFFDGIVRKRFGLNPLELVQEVNRISGKIQEG